MQAMLILTTLPDPDAARQLARQLVEARLAACVNVLAACTSIYRWEAAIQEESETPLLIKTSAGGYAAVETFLLEHHPYELPEIIALPIVQGLPGYLEWVSAQTRV